MLANIFTAYAIMPNTLPHMPFSRRYNPQYADQHLKHSPIYSTGRGTYQIGFTVGEWEGSTKHPLPHLKKKLALGWRLTSPNFDISKKWKKGHTTPSLFPHTCTCAITQSMTQYAA